MCSDYILNVFSKRFRAYSILKKNKTSFSLDTAILKHRLNMAGIRRAGTIPTRLKVNRAPSFHETYLRGENKFINFFATQPFSFIKAIRLSRDDITMLLRK